MSLSEDLQNSTDIVDLVGKYTKLKKVGTNYKSLCPFRGHTEKTPSFVVSPSKQIAYCFGCHKGGGPIKFIMDVEECEFREAIEILASFLGKSLPENTFKSSETREIFDKSIYSIFKDISRFYEKKLYENPEILEYCKKRNLTSETLKNFNIGYSDSGIELYNFLKNLNYEDSLIEKTNIFLDLKSRKDKFLGRLIFPIENRRGDIVAFAGRIIHSGEPKYLNSPASNIYDKSSILYGLFKARNEITKKDFVIISEGYMDCIALHKFGFTNSVAVSGTALTEKHIEIISKLTKKVYLCFDSDKAGLNATKLSLELLKNKYLEVKIIRVPNGKDPDEFLQNSGNFEELIQNAKTPIGFYLEEIGVGIIGIEEKRKALKEISAIVGSFSDEIEIDFYVKEIAKSLDLPNAIVYDSIRKARFSKEKIKLDEKVSHFEREELIAGYLLLYENFLISAKVFFEGKENIPNFIKNILNENFEELKSEEKEKLKAVEIYLQEKNEIKTEENYKKEFEDLLKKYEIDLQEKEAEKAKSGKSDEDMTIFLEAIRKKNSLKNK